MFTEVIENPDTPLYILENIANSKEEYFRKYVAESPRLSVKSLRKLASEDNLKIDDHLARNPSVPQEILRKLADKNNKHINISLAQNLNLPLDILDRFANHKCLNLYSIERWLCSEIRDFAKETLKNLKIKSTKIKYYYSFT